ncbi:MAG: hypothetical protein LBS76_02435 [Mycoplasmataceae bacterium]|nr:hypothetical protein [Mycoplasmataceae bacterium]
MRSFVKRAKIIVNGSATIFKTDFEKFKAFFRNKYFTVLFSLFGVDKINCKLWV